MRPDPGWESLREKVTEAVFTPTRSLQFPGGPVVVREPETPALHDSALAWIALAKGQAGAIRALVDRCGTPGSADTIIRREANNSLDMLLNQLDYVRRAIEEARAKETDK